MVRGVVAGLETRFEGLDTKMATSPGLGTLWKTLALDHTIQEIPRIPFAGTETGATTGFGDKIYVPPGELNLSQTVSAMHFFKAILFFLNNCFLHVGYC